MNAKGDKRKAREAAEENARLHEEIKQLKKELAESKQPKRATKK